MMRKTKIANYLKLGILFIGISVLLWNCEKEETLPLNQGVNQERFQARKISFNELNSNQELTSFFTKIQQKLDFNKNTSLTGRDISSNDGSFTILTDNIIEVIENTTTTYAFRIETPTYSVSNFENFVIKKENNTYTFFIYRYLFDENTYKINTQQVDESMINLEDFELYLQTLVYSQGCLFDVQEEYVYVISCGGSDDDGENPSDSNTGGGDTGGTGNNWGNDGGNSNNGGNSDSSQGGSTSGGNNNSNNNNTGDDTAPAAGVVMTDAEIALSEIFECFDNSGGLSPVLGTYLSQQAQESHNTLVFDIQSFINNNGGCSTENNNFIELALEALKEGAEVDWEDKIINKLTGKAKCVYDKLKSNSLINSALQEFDGTDALINLELLEANLPSGISGKTTYGIPIKITLDIDDMKDTPSLWGAHTIIHEAIHADIYRKVFITGGMTYTPPNIYTINGTRADFPTLFDYYDNYPNNAQHNYMADYYRTAMENALKEYATLIGETYPDQLYKDIAWAGLHNTNAWNNMYADPVFTANEQNRINQAIKDFKNSGTNECN